MVESKESPWKLAVGNLTAIEFAVAAKMLGFEDKYSLMMTKQCDSLREENGDICIFCGEKNCR